MTRRTQTAILADGQTRRGGRTGEDKGREAGGRERIGLGLAGRKKKGKQAQTAEVGRRELNPVLTDQVAYDFDSILMYRVSIEFYKGLRVIASQYILHKNSLLRVSILPSACTSYSRRHTESPFEIEESTHPSVLPSIRPSVRIHLLLTAVRCC